MKSYYINFFAMDLAKRKLNLSNISLCWPLFLLTVFLLLKKVVKIFSVSLEVFTRSKTIKMIKKKSRKVPFNQSMNKTCNSCVI